MSNIEIDELKRKSRVMVLWAIVAWVVVIGVNVWLFYSFLDEKTREEVTGLIAVICLFGFMIFLPALIILLRIDRKRDAKFKKKIDIQGFFRDIEKEHKGVLSSLWLVAVAEKSLFICGYGILLGIWIVISSVYGIGWFFMFGVLIVAAIYVYGLQKVMKSIYSKRGIIAPMVQYTTYFMGNFAGPLIKNRYGFELKTSTKTPPEVKNYLKRVGVKIKEEKVFRFHTFSGFYTQADVVYSIHGDKVVIYFLKMLWESGGRNSKTEYGLLSVAGNAVHFENSKNLSFGLMNPQVQLFKLCKYLDK